MRDYIRCQIPILPVKSVTESLTYYRDKLGFEIAWVWDEDGYAAVRCGEIEIHLDRQEHFAVYRAHSYWFVENADEVYAAYKNNGVDIVQDIESKPWGVREFTFADIDGHMFRVAHEESEKA
ncbi:bleomycin resistance protein [Paenibacillus hamazuiensis]|uniref:bleomycin resistance protein n=1 Tax=Paenibacillus hamazuiensis TaxID=2936508 RepID=UPI00200C522A